MEPGVIYLGGDYLWMPVFPTGLSRTCLAQSRHSSHVCWMRENPCCIIRCIKKNSVGHKYQKRTHAKLGKLGKLGTLGGYPRKVPSSLRLSLGSSFHILSHCWPSFSALQNSTTFIFKFIGPQLQKETSPSFRLFQFLNFRGQDSIWPSLVGVYLRTIGWPPWKLYRWSWRDPQIKEYGFTKQ